MSRRRRPGRAARAGGQPEGATATRETATEPGSVLHGNADLGNAFCVLSIVRIATQQHMPVGGLPLCYKGSLPLLA